MKILRPHTRASCGCWFGSLRSQRESLRSENRPIQISYQRKTSGRIPPPSTVRHAIRRKSTTSGELEFGQSNSAGFPRTVDGGGILQRLFTSTLLRLSHTCKDADWRMTCSTCLHRGNDFPYQRLWDIRPITETQERVDDVRTNRASS
jgi:hypothetical protein